jgi:hypothetical protein
LKEHFNDIPWVAPGDGNGLVKTTMAHVIATDPYPQCPGVEEGTIEQALTYLEDPRNKKIPYGLVLSYVTAFMTPNQMERVGKLDRLVVVFDVRPVIMGKVSYVKGYGITTNTDIVLPLVNRTDTQLYAGIYSENLLSQENLMVVELNAAVFYLARMRPLYVFRVNDVSLEKALKTLMIPYQVGQGIPLVSTMDQVVMYQDMGCYYYQVGKVVQGAPKEIILAKETELISRQLYKMENNTIFNHEALRFSGPYLMAVSECEFTTRIDTSKEKSVRRVKFREVAHPGPLRYSIVWQSHLLILSPIQAKVQTGYQFITHLSTALKEWKWRDSPLRGVLVDMGVSEKDQTDLCTELCLQGMAYPFASRIIRNKVERKRKKRVTQFCCKFNLDFAEFIGFDPGHKRPGIEQGIHPHPGPKVVCLGPQGTFVTIVPVTETEFTIRGFMYANLRGSVPFEDIRFTTIEAVVIGEGELLERYFDRGMLLLNYYDMREVMAPAV